MIVWFYSKLAVFLFCVLVFLVLVTILYDFLASEVYLHNVVYGKFLMYLHYLRYFGQGNASIVLQVTVPPSKTEYYCRRIYCTLRWKFLGYLNNITYIIPYYYNTTMLLYAPGKRTVTLRLVAWH
ncbi:MAG: hypothetical protein GXO42_02765 [bacterium]|nr:hypothetical protein [bacterium]